MISGNGYVFGCSASILKGGFKAGRTYRHTQMHHVLNGRLSYEGYTT